MHFLSQTITNQSDKTEENETILQNRVYASVAITSIVTSVKCHVAAGLLTSLGHSLTCAITFTNAGLLGVPVACAVVYTEKRNDRLYEIALRRNANLEPTCKNQNRAIQEHLESLPLNIPYVDRMLLNHKKGDKDPMLTLNWVQIQITREILEKIIARAFGNEDELVYFNPTNELCYTLTKCDGQTIKKELSVEEIQALLDSGENYKGIIVSYARGVLEKTPLYTKEMPENKDCQIHAYDYTTALTQISVACTELQYLQKAPN